MVAVRKKIDINMNAFDYPLSIDNLKEIRNDILIDLIDLVRNGSTNDVDVQVLFLNLQSFTTEILTLYTALSLIENGSEDLILNYAPALYLARGECPKPTVYSRRMQKCVQRDPSWKKLGRFVKSAVIPNSIQYTAPVMNRPRHVLTFSNAPLILEHQKEEGVRLIRNDYSDWFPSNVLDVSQVQNAFEGALEKEVLNIIRESFNQRGTQITELALVYLQTVFCELSELTKCYLSSVQKKVKYLPDRLWIGSTGMFLNRVMAFCARQNGRYVCGHDHGTGSGWLDTIDQTVVEFNYMDEFYTYTEKMAKGLSENIPSHFLIQNALKDRFFTYPKNRDNSRNNYKSTRLDKTSLSHNKKLLFVGTQYMKDLTDFIPRLPYDVHVRWHKNLFNYLLKEDFEIVFRPHPDDDAKNYSFIKNMGIALDPVKRLDQSAKLYDLCLLDFSCSTALVELIRHDVPTVLLDCGHERLTVDGLKLLKKSCLYFSVNYDQGHMPQVPNQLAYKMKNYEIRSHSSDFLDYFE